MGWITENVDVWRLDHEFHAGMIRRVASDRSDYDRIPDRIGCWRRTWLGSSNGRVSRLWAMRSGLSLRLRRFDPSFLSGFLVLALNGPVVTLADSGGMVTLSGSVEQRCAITASPTSADLGTLSGAGSKELSFTYTCNTPFAYQLQSTNGALKHKTLSGQTGFFNSLAYTVEVNLPTDGSSISQTVVSSNLTEGSITTFTNSGSAIAIDKTGTLTLNWNAPELETTSPLLAGDYRDSLTLTLSAQQ